MERALGQALAGLPPAAAQARHAATMTGELADLFADRDEGVRRIVETLRQRFGEARLRLFAGEPAFLDPEQARRAPASVASANCRTLGGVSCPTTPMLSDCTFSV